MPLYEYQCDICGNKTTVMQNIHGDSPQCCDGKMRRLISYPAMVKIMGAGGYPSRRKFLKGSAPYTSRSTAVWGDYDPSRRYDISKGFIKDEG